jgi:hypothetical protein
MQCGHRFCEIALMLDDIAETESSVTRPHARASESKTDKAALKYLEAATPSRSPPTSANAIAPASEGQSPNRAAGFLSLAGAYDP